MEINDDIRRRVVAEHLATGRTQAATCAAFNATYGRKLSARALRSWISRVGPAQPSIDIDDYERGVLVAVLHRLRELHDEIERALWSKSIAAPHRPPAAAPTTTAPPPLLAEPAAGSHPAEIHTEVSTPTRRFSFDD